MKPFLNSKTVRFGGTLALLGLAIITLPEFQRVIEQVPAEYQGLASLAVGVIVVVLRHLTTEPLSTNREAVEATDTEGPDS